MKARLVLRTGGAWAVTLSIVIHAVALLAVSFIVVSAGSFTPPASEPFNVSLTSDWNTAPVELADASVDTADPLRAYMKNCILADEAANRTDALNGFRDSDDGGSEYAPVTSRSGGGGGDDRAEGEFGHIRPTENEWKNIARKRVLTSQGAGHGRGDGAGEGALGSSGSGTGSGAGANGIGFGNGTGKAAKTGLTRPAILIDLEDAHHRGLVTHVRTEVTVTLAIEVLADGQVGAVKIQKPSGNDAFDKSAAKAAQNWHFKPALQGGEPTASWITIKQTKY